MKHLLSFSLCILCISFSLSSQNIPKENVRSMKDFKRLNDLQQMPRQACQHEFADSPIQLQLLLNEKPFKKMLNKVLSSKKDIYVVDTVFVHSTDGIYRYLYTYDANGNQLSELMEGWFNNQWVSWERHTWTYDANGNMLSELTEVWSNNLWEIYDRMTYTYDANRNMLSRLQEDWFNNQWVNIGRGTYTYDAQGNMLSELWEWWQNNQWESLSRQTHTYDANGNQLSSLEERWRNNRWENYERYTWTYDANGNMLSQLYEGWYNYLGVISYRNTYTYDANRNMLSMLSEDWTNNQWVNSYRKIYTYDEDNRLMDYLSELWSNNQWETYGRNTYTYDVNGNQLLSLFERWSNNQWVNGWHYMFKYNQNNLVTERLREYWNGSSWVPIPASLHGYDKFFYNGYKVNLSYKLIMTDVSKNDGMIATVYSLSQNFPNPFNPTTTIRYQIPLAPSGLNPPLQRGNATKSKGRFVSLKIYDMLGREVATLVNEEQSAGLKEVKWNATGFASGMYLVRMQSGSFVDTKKILLMK